MFRKCPICDAEATWTDEGLQTHIRNCADTLRARLALLEKVAEAASREILSFENAPNLATASERVAAAIRGK